jgi:hypothetical protein
VVRSQITLQYVEFYLLCSYSENEQGNDAETAIQRHESVEIYPSDSVIKLVKCLLASVYQLKVVFEENKLRILLESCELSIDI